MILLRIPFRIDLVLDDLQHVGDRGLHLRGEFCSPIDLLRLNSDNQDFFGALSQGLGQLQDFPHADFMGGKFYFSGLGLDVFGGKAKNRSRLPVHIGSIDEQNLGCSLEKIEKADAGDPSLKEMNARGKGLFLQLVKNVDTDAFIFEQEVADPDHGDFSRQEQPPVSRERRAESEERDRL
jgi:hypothetical protein